LGALKSIMMNPDCDFDENYYAYYSDQEIDGQSGLISSLYIGGQMGGKNRQGKLFVLRGSVRLLWLVCYLRSLARVIIFRG